MRIVLCGSMKVKDKIILVDEELKQMGYDTLLPVECMQGLPKKIASMAHFTRIEDKDTDAILVVNSSKNDIENYIGPNSFAEIALAFFKNKKIYLYNDIYSPFEDELVGWDVIPLKGNLNNIDNN